MPKAIGTVTLWECEYCGRNFYGKSECRNHEELYCRASDSPSMVQCPHTQVCRGTHDDMCERCSCIVLWKDGAGGSKC